MISLVLLIFALVLFLVAALVGAQVEPWRNRLGLLGLACWVGSFIVSQTLK